MISLHGKGVGEQVCHAISNIGKERGDLWWRGIVCTFWLWLQTFCIAFWHNISHLQCFQVYLFCYYQLVWTVIRALFLLHRIKWFCKWTFQALVQLHRCSDWFGPLLWAYSMKTPFLVSQLLIVCLSKQTMTNLNQMREVLLFVHSKMADWTNLSSNMPVADRTKEVWGRKLCRVWLSAEQVSALLCLFFWICIH